LPGKVAQRPAALNLLENLGGDKGQEDHAQERHYEFGLEFHVGIFCCEFAAVLVSIMACEAPNQKSEKGQDKAHKVNLLRRDHMRPENMAHGTQLNLPNGVVCFEWGVIFQLL
jgi:hypothetical protein